MDLRAQGQAQYCTPSEAGCFRRCCNVSNFAGFETLGETNNASLATIEGVRRLVNRRYNAKSLTFCQFNLGAIPMFMEVAEIEIKAGAEPLFEAAVQKAVELFQRAKGCSAMRLERSVEQPLNYILLVQWETIEDHMVHFRESDDFAQWRTLVGEHFAAPPRVGHTTTVVAGF